MKSPFFIVRYANGSGGRFLSTAFQLSKSIACWDHKLEELKSYDKFDFNFLNYVDLSFPIDPTEHLLLEPDLPYFTDFYSGTYERGNDLTFNDYCRYLWYNKDRYFYKNIMNKKLVNLILHKSHIPKFMEGSIIVNIIINSSQSMELVQKLLWNKHYDNSNSEYIIDKPNHPKFCNPKRKHITEKYQNTSILYGTHSDIYKEKILDNYEFTLFSNTELLYHHESNLMVSNVEFLFDNFFTFDLFVDNYKSICNTLNIDFPNLMTLKQVYNIWWDRQNV